MKNRLAALATLIAAVSPAAIAQDAAGWRSDLHLLAAELPKRHANPFRRVTREQFQREVDALDARIPSLRREQIAVGFMHLVSLAADGHTSIHPYFDPSLRFRYYPVSLYLFRDGLFVRAADSAHRDLVGARVVRIGRVSAESAMVAVGTIVSRENDQWLKSQGPRYLTLAEVLGGLNLVDDMEHATLVVEQSGATRTVTLTPAGVLEPRGHTAMPVIDRSAWVDMRQESSAREPLWVQQPDDWYWMRYLPESRTLYVCYRNVLSMPGSESNPDFFKRVLAFADSAPVDRFVLDIRENGGGNNFLNLALIRGITHRPKLDRRGGFFVIIGRATFSAAQNLVNELERYTNATFVGEPTGNAPNLYGDAQPLILPKSGLRVAISTIYWQTMNPKDARLFVAPRIAADLTSSEYRRNIDPAMVAIDRFGSRKTLAELLAPALSRTDTTAAFEGLRAYRADPSNVYADVEAEMNALGYAMLNGGRTKEAIIVFASNAMEFPRSANVFDSLGEAYEQSGDRARATAAYRHALELSPTLASSRAALERLH